MTENHALENYHDQIKQLEKELEMSDKNKEMFYSLWIKWASESDDIQRAIMILEIKIESLTDDNISYDDIIFCKLNDIDPIDLHYYKNDPSSIYYKTTP